MDERETEVSAKEGEYEKKEEAEGKERTCALTGRRCNRVNKWSEYARGLGQGRRRAQAHQGSEDRIRMLVTLILCVCVCVVCVCSSSLL